jgi:hypothetical protein
VAYDLFRGVEPDKNFGKNTVTNDTIRVYGYDPKMKQYSPP